MSVKRRKFRLSPQLYRYSMFEIKACMRLRGLAISKRFLLLANPSGVFKLRTALGVQLDVGRPLRRHVSVMENRLHGTFRCAGIAIDARLRIDIEHVLV